MTFSKAGQLPSSSLTFLSPFPFIIPSPPLQASTQDCYQEFILGVLAYLLSFFPLFPAFLFTSLFLHHKVISLNLAKDLESPKLPLCILRVFRAQVAANAVQFLLNRI